ncbi:hypothetical protein XELAEV_18005959mg [Xenopus laevis]|uniref:GIY-YIG domain-containing protein n=1 Tax=Xenopus laevis TaxID=8355 RepID=A0A974DYZ9_XENLA|nr:hypothetical protein XELAEV_18005959mg [Xenopus laevis]
MTNKERKCQGFKSNQTNKEHKIDQLITSDTTNVVYLLECPCKKQNVVRTTRKLRVRLGEHIRNIKKGFKSHSVSDPSGLKVIGISHKTRNWRGGNKVQIIFQEETRWKISLKMLQPHGLNIELDINCFI